MIFWATMWPTLWGLAGVVWVRVAEIRGKVRVDEQQNSMLWTATAMFGGMYMLGQTLYLMGVEGWA